MNEQVLLMNDIHRKWLRRLLLLAVVAASGLIVWRWRHPEQLPIAVPPEIPSTVTDPDVVAALTEARNSVQAHPRSGQAWGELGMIFRAHELTTESNVCFDEAAKFDPTDPRWPYMLGLHYYQIGSDEVLAPLQKAYQLAKDPEYKSAVRLRLAEAMYQRSQFDGAEKLFQEELSVNPQSPRAMLGLGVLAIERSDHQRAVQYLNAAVYSPYAHRKASGLLAASYRQLCQVALAEEYEREASKGSDESWPDPYVQECLRHQTGLAVRLWTADDLDKQGKYEDAAKIREEIVKTNPDEQVLVSLGINLVKLHRYKRAEQVLRAALNKSPDRAITHDFLGVSLSMQGEEKWKAGDRDGAVPLFKAALIEFRKSSALNPEGLGHLHAGIALKYLDQLAEAADEYRLALQTGPQNAITHLSLGEVLIEMGKPDEAVPHLQTAARLAPADDNRARVLLDKATGKHK